MTVLHRVWELTQRLTAEQKENIIGGLFWTAFKCIVATDPYLIHLECLNRNNVFFYFVLAFISHFAMRAKYFLLGI